jgi:hypothetical protein
MLIRSTPHACFVILENGLTLELFYDETLSGLGTGTSAQSDTLEHSARSAPTASQGVWLMGESVLFEVSAGQA